MDDEHVVFILVIAVFGEAAMGSGFIDSSRGSYVVLISGAF